MNDLLLRIVNMALVAIEFFAFVVLTSSFFIPRQSKNRVAIINLVGYLLNYIVLVVLGSAMIPKMLLTCLLFTVILWLIYRAHPALCCVLAIVYLSVITAFDGVILFLISWITGESMGSLMSSPYGYYLLSLFAKTGELLAVAIIRAWAKVRFQHRQATLQGYLRVVIFPFVTLVSTGILLNAFFQYPNAAPQLFACVFIFLLSDVAAIVLLDQIETQQQAILENRILQQELRLAHDNISALSGAYSTERKLTHEFQNQLLVIQGLINENPSTQAVTDYLEQLMKQSYTKSLAITTHRIVVDVILNQKYQMAIEKKISFCVQLSDLSEFPLSDDAFVVILSNVLDNAIEACERIEDPSKRRILVKAHSSGTENLFYVENSVSTPVKIVENRIESAKAKSIRHGYGLQNVSAIIKASGGAYAISCDEHTFSFVMHFHQQEKTTSDELARTVVR